MTPQTIDAMRLFMESIGVFARAERAGIRVDIPYCQGVQSHLARQIQRLDGQIRESEFGRAARKTYGSKFNPDSDEQLAYVLFDVLGHQPVNTTDSGKPSCDAESLEALGDPDLMLILRKRKLDKCRGTYIQNFIKESIDGFIHPFYNLNNVVTFRSSSDSPNFQNIPNRDPEIKGLCRNALFPRIGHKAAFLDFSGVEVRVSACYHKDPTMFTYIHDETTDMHRDMAMEIYRVPLTLMKKPIRQAAKNKFVFPEFYGDWYRSCAKALWAEAHMPEMVLSDDTPLMVHLERNGLGTYELFEKHVQAVEHAFWYDKFPVYTQWKEDHWDTYQKRGFFDTLTGFRCGGVMAKNQAINFPVQGSAFHCTLWCMNQIDKHIIKNKMRSRLCGQIHDEVIIDIHPREEQEILGVAKRIMTKDIREHWDWLIVPIDVEVALTTVDGSWATKKEIKL